MATPGITGRTRPTKVKKRENQLKRNRDDVDVDKLEQAVQALDPKHVPYKNFTDLPLSDATKQGLKSAHFAVMTDIQAKAIPLALLGHDILGAAKTGSGKTLSFLIPVLDNLYRLQHQGSDAGLGALILSPTRELAIQIFDVLRKIGKHGHMFAAGLLIGGKSLEAERQALTKMNILVATPGRMLQHLSSTAVFSVDDLKMLVLDEADRILDMGFQRDVDAIIEYLPTQRQTLLFSATQSRKVSDLARLSLQDPEYISAHAEDKSATPQSLTQNYIVCPQEEKLDTLWSFLQVSKKSKVLCFFSSAKSVRFVYEAFRHMQPGIPLLHIHGRQKQSARLDNTARFTAAKYSCLFATDIAARGLDFPAVDFVIQVDCPDDVETYIHRVGRTARYNRKGRGVLFLTPSEEEGMLKRMESKKVPVELINVRQKKRQSIKDQLQHMCFQDPALKYLGQKAFSSHTKSIYLQKDKEIFDLKEYNWEAYAASLGLSGTPRIKFLSQHDRSRKKQMPKQTIDVSGSSDAEEGTAKKKPTVRTKYDRMFERQNQDVLADHYRKIVQDGADGSAISDFTGKAGDDGADYDFMAVKRRISANDDEPFNFEDGADSSAPGGRVVNLPGASQPLVIDSNRREKLLKSKKKLLPFMEKGKKLIYDDDGNAHEVYELENEEQFQAKGLPEDQRQEFIRSAREMVQKVDEQDKVVAKARKKDKLRKKKDRVRGETGDQHDNGEAVEVGSNEEDPLANFLADAQSADDESDGRANKGKKEKEWFESDSDDDQSGNKKKKKKHEHVVHEPQTLEQLEALAGGLLG